MIAGVEEQKTECKGVEFLLTIVADSFSGTTEGCPSSVAGGFIGVTEECTSSVAGSFSFSIMFAGRSSGVFGVGWSCQRQQQWVG